MNYLYLGKIVNTHGIKGELRISSNIDKKDKIFIPGMKLYIGKNKDLEVISSYRHHKVYEMITLVGYNDINQVLKYKGLNVYINRDDIKLNEDEYLLEELIGFSIINNGLILGKVKEIVYNNSNILLYIMGDKDFYIPYKGDFINKVNIKNKEIIVSNIEGLML